MKRVKHRRPISRVELILQSCPAENGAAALAMVLSYYRKPAVMRELMQRPIASAADLVAAAQSKGLYAQGYQMSFDQLCQAPMPLIAHWRFRSFVVVTGVRGGRVYVNSPEEGCLILSRREFEAGFTGVAVCFADSAEPAAEKHRREPLRLGRTVPALLAAAQLLIAAGFVVLSVLLRSVAARLSSPQPEGGLSLCLALGLVLLLQGAAAAFQVWLLRRCQAFRVHQNDLALRERLDSEPAAFFQRTDPLRLTEAIRGCSAGPEAMARSAICLAQMIGGAVCLVVMAVQNWAAALAAALVAVAFSAVCLRRREALYSDGALHSRAQLAAEDLAARDLAAWERIRLHGEDGSRFQRWAGETGGAYRPAAGERQRGYWYIAAAGELLLVFSVCLLEMIAGLAGTADLLGCTVLAAAVAAAMGALPGFLLEQAAVRRCRVSAAQVFSDQQEPPVPSGIIGPAEALTMQNVSLRSADGAAVIRGVTFTVRRGEILVVVGDAPARTALASVASGLERPSQGTLYLDSRSTLDLSEQEICGSITLLGDGLPFPRGTVRENIAVGFDKITDYAVAEAAADALLHQRILMHTGGYDTPASALSDGERTLLAFARAFARGTPFLVCNGLLETLDVETADNLIRNMRRRGIGVVLLTSDPSLLRRGDMACRIEAGQLILRERADFVEEVHSLV